ncbi:MAG: hypothetical protein AMJ79_07105 [Phycisphaerae bacterium SM23_30]|nr:MAG: hypothetical protein AMJ79_07105 [Phycisphaerae bacterium SM23_30]
MKSIKTKLLLTASILVCLTGSTLAQDQQIPNREIKFETSDQQEDWYYSWEGMGVIKPKFVAKFTLKKNRTFESLSRSRPQPTARATRAISASQTLGVWMFEGVVSEQQMAFIKQNRYQTSESFDDAGLYRDYMFYAVTDEDARNMAQRFIEYHDQIANSRLQELKDNIPQNEKIIYEAEKRLPQLEAELEPLEELVKDLGVRYNDNRSLAEERRTEFYKILSLLKIDIAGYQAKVEALREHMKSIPSMYPPRTPSQLYAAVKQMLIEQEAELAGALARQKEIELQIAHINEFTQAYSKRSLLRGERSGLNSNMNTAIKQIQESEQTLAIPPDELLPVELLENKVIIYPVREK